MAKSRRLRALGKLARAGRMNPPWEEMLTETGIRSRIEKENPDALKVLDYLRMINAPFTDGKGWTVFNDWLDMSYRLVNKRWPSNIPRIDLDLMRGIIFVELNGNPLKPVH